MPLKWGLFHCSLPKSAKSADVGGLRAYAVDTEVDRLFLWRDMELQPHGTDDLQHGAERWIAVLAQRLVEAGPGHAGLLRKLADAAGARDVAQGGGDEGRIVAAFLQAGLEVERDVLLALEVIRG